MTTKAEPGRQSPAESEGNMETYITESIRVIIKQSDGIFPFLICTEQKATESSLPWEVDEDGWRPCVIECATTMEDAINKYERQISDERRWH